MSAQIIDGTAIATALRADIAKEVAELKAKKGIVPELGVVLVGDYAASKVYVTAKVKACREAGIRSNERVLPSDIDQESLIGEIQALNNSPDTHGILVQLPLPKHIDERAILSAVDPKKDVDGFHPVNAGKLWSGDESGFVPCTPLGCLHLIKQFAGPLAGKTAVVIGRSNIVGKPVAALLLREDCTVTIAHSRTQNLADVVRAADIVVAAVGKPLMVKGDWIKQGAVVIDVGINRIGLPDGTSKLLGDVAFEECLAKTSAITPVPKGVGPMTIAYLLKNTLKAAAL